MPGYHCPATAEGLTVTNHKCYSIAIHGLRPHDRRRGTDRRALAARADGRREELFRRQLADILAYAEQVQAIDTSGVPATAHVHARESMERADELRACLPVTDALANAPDAAPDAGLFRVPRVIG